MRSFCRLACVLAVSLTLAGCGLFRSASEGTPTPAGESGSIELSLIDRSTLKPAAAHLHWNVRTHPSHVSGEQVVYNGNSSKPRLQLAEGWYLVEVQHDRGVTTHVFEIYPGVHQDMHLVRMTM
ncbi:MAG TPA: hypothetical protein VK035_09370 [Kiloniellales bacterium]|nr:hypothetical protein [Kiloniellales bacterium]